MRKNFLFIWVVLVTGILVVSSIACVTAQQDSDNDGISDAKEEQLASLYEPVLHFASGEKFFPTDPNYHIQNSVLYMKTGETNTKIDNTPTATSIAQYTAQDYFLNNTLGGYDEIAQDYTQNRENYGDKIYAHVTREGQYIAVQYWFFYAYNPGNINQHQGDWEMIEVVLDSTETPLYAVYSQHHSGEMAEWQDVEKSDETHLRVYVALGSHANYFRSYQGKLGTASDTVGNAYTLAPEDLEIVMLGELGAGNHPSSQSWLQFGGRWGNWADVTDEYLGAAGPRGPGQGENAEKWSYPVSWGSNRTVADGTVFTANLLVYYLAYILAAIVGALALFKVWKIVKRQKQGKLNLMKILRSKAALAVILGIVGVAVQFVAVFSPWYIVTGDIKTQFLETAGTTEIVLIDGANGLRINMLQGDQGLTTLFGLGIPFGLIFLAGAVLMALDIIGVEKTTELSKKYIRSGITTLIPVIIIILVVVAFAGLVNQFAGFIGGTNQIPPQVTELASAMSSSPLGGGYTDTIGATGTVDIAWGLAFGAYLFAVAAVIKIVAGIMLRMSETPE